MKALVEEITSLVHDFIECLLIGILLGAIGIVGVILHDTASRPVLDPIYYHHIGEPE